MKLSVRLLILVLFAALPVLALQVNALIADREQRKTAISHQALTLARLSAAQQNQFIEGARYLLGAAAKLPEVQNRDSASCDARMAELLGLFPTIAGIGAVAPDGTQFCAGQVPTSGQEVNINDRPYFQAALSEKRLAISGFLIGRASGKPQLNFAYPALDKGGKVQAVVVLAFDLTRLSGSLLTTPMPDGATTSLVDAKGVLLARAPPAPDSIGRAVSEGACGPAKATRHEGVLGYTVTRRCSPRPICSRSSVCRGRPRSPRSSASSGASWA
jgi:C4-dicarboxylate-specific signal transduction histidine kinase